MWIKRICMHSTFFFLADVASAEIQLEYTSFLFLFWVTLEFSGYLLQVLIFFIDLVYLISGSFLKHLLSRSLSHLFPPLLGSHCVHLNRGHVGSPCYENRSLLCSIPVTWYSCNLWPYPDCTGREHIWVFLSRCNDLHPVHRPGDRRYVIHYGAHLALGVGRGNLGHVLSRLLVIKFCWMK